MVVRVINCKKQELQRIGYDDLLDFLKDPNNMYVGRSMPFVPGAKSSKWHNPFKLRSYGNDANAVVALYKDYIRRTPELYESLHELRGKTLACWCYPDPCHATALKELYNERFVNSRIND